jgi:hypothetical protein
VNYNSHILEFIQILDGKTAFDLNGQRLFFKHSSIRDQESIIFLYKKYEETALKKGIETTEEVYKRLTENGDWNEKDDLKISELKTYVTNLKKSKDKFFLPSQKENHQKLIDEEESQLNFLLNKKNELIGLTVEDYANRMANEEFLRTLIYSDEELKCLKFNNEDFGLLTSSELNLITKKYYEMSLSFSDPNIQKIVLQDFFNMYLSLCEKPYEFFGKFIQHLSIYQMKLLLYGKIFNNIFQYHDDIPEQIRKDPEAIFNFVDSKKNRDKYQSMQKDSGASVIFGAKDSDLDIIDPNAKKVSLAEEIKKNGGSLNMEQMMKLMGQ